MRKQCIEASHKSRTYGHKCCACKSNSHSILYPVYVNPLMNKSTFRKFEKDFLAGNFIPSELFNNWIYKDRRITDWSKVVAKCMTMLGDKANESKEQKSDCVCILKLLQRILYFSNDSLKLDDTQLIITIALCDDEELSIQAYKVLSLCGDIQISNLVQVEMLLKYANLPNVHLSNYNGILEYVTDEYTSAYTIMRRLYTVIVLYPYILNDDIYEIIRDNINLPEIILSQKKDKEMKFCVETFILLIMSMEFEPEYMKNILGIDSPQGYIYNALENDDLGFDNILLLEIVEECYKNDKIDVNFEWFTFENEDLEFKYLCVLYNLIRKYRRSFINESLRSKLFANANSRSDFFVLKMTYKILQEIYKDEQEPFEESELYFLCVQNKKEASLQFRIATLTFFMNQDPLSIPNIVHNMFPVLYDRYDIDLATSVINMLDAMSLDKNIGESRRQEKLLSKLFTSIFDQDDIGLLEPVSKLSLSVTTLLRHHPEYRDEVINFVADRLQHLKNVADKKVLNALYFLKFLSILEDSLIDTFDTDICKVIDRLITSNNDDLLYTIISSRKDIVSVVRFFTMRLLHFYKNFEVAEKYLYILLQVEEDDLKSNVVLFYILLDLYLDLYKNHIDPIQDTLACDNEGKEKDQSVIDHVNNGTNVNDSSSERNNRVLFSSTSDHGRTAKYIKKLRNEKTNVEKLLYIEVKYLINHILLEEDGYGKSECFKVLLEYATGTRASKGDIKRHNKELDFDTVYTIYKEHPTIAICTDEDLRAVWELIEKSRKKFKHYNLNVFINYVLSSNEKRYSYKEILQILQNTNCDFESLDKQKIYNFLCNAKVGDKKLMIKVINKWVRSSDDKDKSIKLYKEHAVPGVRVEYKKMFEDVKFLQVLLHPNAMQTLVKNKTKKLLSIMIHTLNNTTSFTKQYIALCVYVADTLTYSSIRSNVGSLDTSNCAIRWDILQSDISNTLKLKYAISAMKYVKARGIAVSRHMYKLIVEMIVSVTITAADEKHKMLARILLHHIFMPEAYLRTKVNTQNVSVADYVKYNSFIGFWNMHVFKTVFETILGKNAEVRTNDLEIAKSKMYKHLFKECHKHPKLLNSVTELLYNYTEYRNAVPIVALRKLINDHVMSIDIQERIEQYGNFDSVAILISICLRPEKDALFDGTMSVIIDTLNKCQKLQLYNIVMFMYRVAANDNNGKFIYESFIHHGIPGIIFDKLARSQEVDYLLTKSVSSYIKESSYEDTNAWNNIRDNNKISFIYSFVRDTYKSVYPQYDIPDSPQSLDFSSEESELLLSPAFSSYEEESTNFDSDEVFIDENFTSELYTSDYYQMKEHELTKQSIQVYKKKLTQYLMSTYRIQDAHEKLNEEENKEEKVVALEDENIDEFSEESSVGIENGYVPDVDVDFLNSLPSAELEFVVYSLYEERKRNNLNYTPIDKSFLDQLDTEVRCLFEQQERILEDEMFQYNSSSTQDEKTDNTEAQVNTAGINPIVLCNFVSRYIRSYTSNHLFYEIIRYLQFDRALQQMINIAAYYRLKALPIEDSDNVIKCLQIINVNPCVKANEFVYHIFDLLQYEFTRDLCLSILHKLEFTCSISTLQICKLIEVCPKKYLCKISSRMFYNGDIDLIDLFLSHVLENEDKVEMLSTIASVFFAYIQDTYDSQLTEVQRRHNLDNNNVCRWNFLVLYKSRAFFHNSILHISSDIYDKFLLIMSNLYEQRDKVKPSFILIFAIYESFVNLLTIYYTTNMQETLEKFHLLRTKFEEEKKAHCIVADEIDDIRFLLKYNVVEFTAKYKYIYSNLSKANYFNKGQYTITVKRQEVLENTFFQIMNKSRNEFMDKKIIVRFADEEGLDYGGLTREWLEILIRQFTDPNIGLFVFSSDKKTTLTLYQYSGTNPDHLLYYKLFGRIIAKAIIDNYKLSLNLDRSIYKYMINKKCDLKDLEYIDPQFYKSLIWIKENSIDNVLSLTFIYETNELGNTHEIEMIPNGRNIQVTDSNKTLYIQLVLENKIWKNIEKQLMAIKEGLYEIIREDVLNILNENELELLICGVPDINVDEWINATTYNGYTRSSQVILWFWKIVRCMKAHERAKLLQFSTGSSRIPCSRSSVHVFVINKVNYTPGRLPSAHTCFNMLDLPLYTTYEELKRCLMYAINECTEGFGFL